MHLLSSSPSPTGQRSLCGAAWMPGQGLSHINMLLTRVLFLLVALGIGGDSALKSMIDDCRS
ncbi:hypothetical protein SAMN05216575_106138 [Ectopseudomonas alcaliphila]|uniref:Uncharacterized protein n=1 Tax=Ectopseudomonas alcaliphila TaxID=101564 RepID=A0A1G7J6K6_9GAMM|nr:hypothetical protein SAMN05216575_106138 [Pseudomonas alcaliphila]